MRLDIIENVVKSYGKHSEDKYLLKCFKQLPSIYPVNEFALIGDDKTLINEFMMKIVANPLVNGITLRRVSSIINLPDEDIIHYTTSQLTNNKFFNKAVIDRRLFHTDQWDKVCESCKYANRQNIFLIGSINNDE